MPRQKQQVIVPDPKTAADELVESLIPLTLGTLIEHHPSGWEAVSDAVRRLEWPNDPDNLSSDEQEAIENRVLDALPEPLHADFLRLREARDRDEDVAQEAGFIVGLRYARVMGGAR
jgi:hypothetical protein